MKIKTKTYREKKIKKFVWFTKYYNIEQDKYFCFMFDLKKIMRQNKSNKWG